MKLHAALLLAAAWLPQEPARIIVAADANARDKPALDARILCPLSMGQELGLEAREGDWVRVTTCGGGAYVHATLVRPVTDATRAAVREALVRERLAREADGFASADGLIRLVQWWGRERSSAGDREGEARYALYELRAIRNASNATYGVAGFRSVLMHLIGETSPMLVYNEPAGSWMLRDEHIWKTYERYKDTNAADDIALFATENGLPGECEGYVPCYLGWLDRLQGEYLRRSPRGRHVAAALDRVVEVVGFAGEPPRIDFEGVGKAAVCKDLADAMTPLRATVVTTAAPSRAAALSALDRLSALCR